MKLTSMDKDPEGWKANLKNYTSDYGQKNTKINPDSSTLSNRLVAVSQTEVIETLSGGDDLPGEINSVGHQHYREYHHHDIYHDVHCDALFHYRVHNITAFHCFFTWVNTSQGRNLITVSSTVFLQADITELWRRVWEISFYLLKHFSWPAGANTISGRRYLRAALLLTVFSRIGFSSMQSGWFMQFIDKTFIFLSLRNLTADHICTV